MSAKFSFLSTYNVDFVFHVMKDNVRNFLMNFLNNFKEPGIFEIQKSQIFTIILFTQIRRREEGIIKSFHALKKRTLVTLQKISSGHWFLRAMQILSSFNKRVMCLFNFDALK